MSDNSIHKQFYGYLWAYILVALSGCLGNVVDGIIVGNLISEDGVSAINLSKPINQFIFTVHLLINAGAGMLVGYALGKKNIADARQFFTRALTLSTGIGLLLTIFGGLLFPTPTARLLCSNEHILTGTGLHAGTAHWQPCLHSDVGTIDHGGRGRQPQVGVVGGNHRQCRQPVARHRVHPGLRLGYHRFECRNGGGAPRGHSYPAQPLAQAREQAAADRVWG